MPPTAERPSDDPENEQPSGVEPHPETQGLVVTGASRWPWYDDHEHRHEPRD
jgi:hypothetical protein